MDEKKTFGYRIGQALAIVTVICAIAIIIGGTVAFLRFIF